MFEYLLFVACLVWGMILITPICDYFERNMK